MFFNVFSNFGEVFFCEALYFKLGLYIVFNKNRKDKENRLNSIIRRINFIFSFIIFLSRDYINI
jgi:hypothetical protein